MFNVIPQRKSNDTKEVWQGMSITTRIYDPVTIKDVDHMQGMNGVGASNDGREGICTTGCHGWEV